MLRFFILAINDENPEFGMFRNIERITDFLTTLITSYKKSRECLKGYLQNIEEEKNQSIDKNDFYISPNEAEFFAYIIIFNFGKSLEVEKYLGILGDNDFDEIRQSPEVKNPILYKPKYFLFFRLHSL